MNQSYDTTTPEGKSQVIENVQPSRQSFSSRLKTVSITFPDGVNLKHQILAPQRDGESRVFAYEIGKYVRRSRGVL